MGGGNSKEHLLQIGSEGERPFTFRFEAVRSYVNVQNRSLFQMIWFLGRLLKAKAALWMHGIVQPMLGFCLSLSVLADAGYDGSKASLCC